MRKKEGFTLVELLVVIAIIALLMSILMPILGKAKSQAKNVICKSSLRQWGAVFSMYANDNQGRFMAGWMGQSPPTNTKHTDQWPSALRPYYFNNEGLRLCPNVKRLTSERFGERAFKPVTLTDAWGAFPDPPGWAVKEGDYGSYGINAWVYNPLDSIQPIPYEELRQSRWRGDNVSKAATVPLFADCTWLDAWPVHTEPPPPVPDAAVTIDDKNSMWRVCIPRHNMRVNYLFLDYSVDEVDLKQLWVLKWHRTFDTCGPYTQCGDVTNWPQWMRKLKDY